MSVIELDHIRKEYNQTIAVKDFSLRSEANEFIVLVGPSGCGKTTLLRMIAGLEEPTSGTITLDGADITGLESQYRNISMVFQSYALYPNMTVYDNLAFPLTLRKLPKTELRERVSRIAEKMELTELLQRKPNTLSGGQRQRVAIGRAMIREPKVFLLDEPLSNLDTSLKDKLREELVSLHMRLNAIFIYVTHDQMEAMAMGDRIVVMNNGVIQQFDTPQNIYYYPANKFVAGFIGSPKMNFISRDTLTLLCPEAAVNADVDSIGLRPEHILISRCAESDACVCRVMNVEMLGKETHYLVEARTETMRICRLGTMSDDICVGDFVKCSADYDRIHFFDADGNRITQ